MPIFRYKGFRAGGGRSAGTLEAESIKDAIHKVKGLGLYPKELSEYAPGKRSLFGRKDAWRLPTVTRQLSVLLQSGVPLVEALRALSDENGGRWRGILIDIRERVSSGASLSRGLEEHEDVFPEFYRNMVASGEASGTLDGVLERLADFLESQDAIREKVRAAMIYPIIMTSVSFVVLSFLFVFVIPKIVRMFEDTKSALPFATVLLIWISNVFVRYWWLLMAGLAAAVFGLKRLRAKHRGVFDKKLMGVFGSLYLGRFARTLGFLLEGGLPMLRALELAGKSSGNIYLEGVSRDAAGKVSEGARLSQALGVLPPVLTQLISTGEKSGRLADVLRRAANSYEADFDRRIKRALALLEPGMILIMGLVVGFIVFAVLLPMFQLNQVIR